MRSFPILFFVATVPLCAIAQAVKERGATKGKDDRTFWRFAKEHGSGYFKQLPDGKWQEIGRDGSKMGLWEELSRTPDYVELYDATRNYKTRLAAGKASMTSGRHSTKFNPSPHGTWEKPNNSRPVAKAPGGKPKEVPKAATRKDEDIPRNDLVLAFIDKPGDFTGKELTAHVRFGYRDNFHLIVNSLPEVVARESDKDAAGRSLIGFFGEGPRHAKIDLIIGVGDLSVPNAKGGDELWVTFKCGNSSTRGNVATKIIRPKR